MTEGSQEFCLRWNNHQATIISVFDYLLENETLVDCTLAAEGQYLKAHKVVLCACSPYLELLLSQHNDKHPILIFKDIKFSELKSMIEYMYKGEVNIAQDQLNHFLKAAESLQIKGLSESEEESTPTAAPTPRPPPPRAPPVQRTQPRPIPNTVALPDPHPESPKRLNRNEAVSPSRKRRRQVLPIQGRPSLSGDDASNASEGHLDQSNCDVPSAALATSDNSVAKVESNSELMLEPKTEYDDNSVEDITLDDDEEDYSQAGTSMDNSQMNFSGWQQMVGDKSGDDVFAGQDTGAQNSQDEKSKSDFVECQYCGCSLAKEANAIMIHARQCTKVDRSGGKHYNYVCYQCEFHSQFNAHLKDHIKRHLRLLDFKCPHCKYASVKRSVLKSHVINKHSNVTRLQCPFCRFSSKLKSQIKFHVKSKHNIAMNDFPQKQDQDAQTSRKVIYRIKRMDSVEKTDSDSREEFLDWQLYF